jgi:predicted RNA-binding Zn-ribbon protein involved in translation (DUF1610 family)
MSIKSKVPLFAIIILLLVAIFFTLWDIFYDEQFIQFFDFISGRQMLLRLIILYCILAIFIIIVLFSTTKKKYDKISQSRRIYEKIIGQKYYQFKCPKCKEIITIKKLKNNANDSLITSCPSCGTIGRIPIPKSSEIKFECSNCGEQVSLWTEGANTSHDVKVYSCPYCGKKQTMQNI